MVARSVRDRVFARDDYRCVHCGTSEGLTIQHRINRGMGGSKAMDYPANLVTMCARSNARLEESAAFADLGRVWGWKLFSHESPTARPVLYPNGDYYLLDNNFRRVLIDG